MTALRTMNKRRIRARDRALNRFRRRHARKIIDFARLYGTGRWASDAISQSNMLRMVDDPLVATDFSAIEARVAADYPIIVSGVHPDDSKGTETCPPHTTA